MASTDALTSKEFVQSCSTTEEDTCEKIFMGFDVKLVKPESCRDGDECPICTFIVKQPVMITNCGHVFCRDCLMQWISQQESSNDKLRCPSDNTEITKDDIVPDKALERVVLNFLVYCKNEEFGCHATPELRDYEAHVKDCEYYYVPCPLLCGRLIIKKSIIEHVTHKCLKRIVDCSICGEKVIFDSHIDVCPLVKLTCTYCNNKDIFRKELDDHLNEECPKYPTYCSFAVFGCNSKIQRQQLAKHNKDSLMRHANFLSGAMQQLFEIVGESLPLVNVTQEAQSPFASIELPLQSRRSLDARNSDGTQPGSELTEIENKSLREDVNTLRKEQRKLHKNISDLMKDNKTLKEANRKLQAQFKLYTRLDVSVGSIDVYDPTSRFYLCPLEWRVELTRDMSEREAKVGCFSKVGGYFFTLLVKCANGGGFDVTCHLLLHENHDSLVWPYPGGEMLEVLEALSDKVLGSDGTPSVEGSVKPTEDWGKPLFKVHLKPPYLHYTIIAIIKKK